QVKKNYHIQRYEFSQQQQLLFTGTSSCSAPATIPQDPDRSHPHILCLQQQQQTIQLPELKVSSITNVPLPGIRPLRGPWAPKITCLHVYMFTLHALVSLQNRANLSPFTKDYRGEEQFNEPTPIFGISLRRD
ncbi:hypothetical protein AVEN_207972-1, partial [Araneus ventricosus]